MGVRALSPPSNKALDYQVPVAAGTVNILASADVSFLNPAGTLATLTVNLPASPSNGKQIIICTTQAITALTMGGGTIVNPATTLVLGGFAVFVFSSTSASWCRCG